MDMNIFEALISFNTAKLAKEKGFQEPCLHHYHDGVLNAHWLENGSSTDIEFRVDLEDLFENINHKTYERFNKGEFYSAPTQALLQKWLRDVHNIHIEIQSPDTTQETWGSHIRYINKFGNRGDCGDSESYEAALEDGLLEALKLIEIENEKV